MIRPAPQENRTTHHRPATEADEGGLQTSASPWVPLNRSQEGSLEFQSPDDAPLNWRETFLQQILFFLAITATISGGISMAVALHAGSYVAAASNLAIVGLLVALAAAKRLTHIMRAYLFIAACFMFALYMLPQVGVLAHKYLIATTFLAALLITPSYAHAFNILCCIIVSIFHLFILDNTQISPRLYETHNEGAFVITFNYAAIATMMTIAICFMTRLIDSAYGQERAARIGLESERAELRKMNLALASEVSARLRAEAKLRDSQQQLKRFLENVPHALFEYDCLKKSFSMYNSSFSKMFSFPEPKLEVTDDELLELVNLEDKESAVRAYRQALSGHSANVELRMQTAGESDRWFLVSGSPVLSPEMGVSQIVGSIQDITDLKKLELANRYFQQRLNEKDVLENLGYLAAGISHDFNNTLAIVLNTAELAKVYLEKASYEAINSLMDDLITATDRGRALSRQLLGFSKQKHVQFVTIDVRKAILESARLLSLVIEQRIRLSVADSQPGLFIRFDPDMLDQAICNLVMNAQDAIDNEGEITIDFHTLPVHAEHELPDDAKMQGASGWVIVSVTDTGSGMTEAVLAAALTPFFTTKDSGKGTGLGLANVQASLMTCGGKVTIDTELGKGTRINLYFPRFPEKENESDIDDSIRGAAGVIVLVDDDEALLRATERTLVLLGHRVEAFVSPLQGLRYVKENQNSCCLLITDLQMPDMHGVELAKEVRSVRQDIPIIFITGYSDAEMKDFKDQSSSTTIVLEKPFKLKEFKAAISSFLA